MKDYFGTPLQIGDIVVAQLKNNYGQITESFRGKIVSAKEQKNGTKLQLERLDFDNSRKYYDEPEDKLYGKFSTSVFKYPC